MRSNFGMISAIVVAAVLAAFFLSGCAATPERAARAPAPADVVADVAATPAVNDAQGKWWRGHYGQRASDARQALTVETESCRRHSIEPACSDFWR